MAKTWRDYANEVPEKSQAKTGLSNFERLKKHLEKKEGKSLGQISDDIKKKKRKGLMPTLNQRNARLRETLQR